ncbi:MAG TPA: hypothetical protein VG796_22790 [Verrucomicrobiales bacterium]|jgi:hypothetical protein|nr:hypothetical protein [Verrucomicrobiales bacterium]
MHFLRLLPFAALWIYTIAARAAEPGFAGDWETTYGHMELKVEGTNVKGTYQVPGGPPNDIRGTVDGLKWTFTYTEPNVEGEGSFTLAKDGQSFTGQWREKGTVQWQPWAGRRAVAVVRNFSGVWKTTFGMMRLVEKDASVTGCYSYGGQSEVSGKTEGGALKFTYTETTGDKGSGEFKLGGDGETFTGTWKTTDGKQGGQWEGTRVKPMAGRTWLVVLEAHWESGLQQPEYSYGDMLRHFFSRVPSVEVRHRYFDGKEDFAKWCEELPYLNEPAVFYVSSHGTEKGITVGKEVLSGDFIGSRLRFAPEVKLVHLGACLTMSGGAPAALRKASGLNMPVSGFTKVADWAGSAVIDFSYLDLVLSRKMPPGEAVRQIKSSVAFAGEGETPGMAIRPAGLKIVE